jgi:hypothetical protein
MKNKHSHRASSIVTSFAALFLLIHGGARAAVEPPGLIDKTTELRPTELKVMDVLLETYADTDWSAVAEHIRSFPEDGGNPNVMVIPLSLGNVLLNRYEKKKNASDFELALLHFESVAKQYPAWKARWLTPGVVQYLGVSVHRLRNECEPYVAMPSPGWHKRVERLWKDVKRILKQEADFRLTIDLPHLPYESCFTGDTKAEENAWEAALFAAAANFLPADSQAAVWEQRARQLAYDAITRPSDPPDAAGVKTCTVEEDLMLSNHGYAPNPYYAGATLALLAQGALTYRLTGHPIPDEFMHNVPELYSKYSSYLAADLTWNVPSDPEGDGSLFPLLFNPDLEKKAVSKKASAGYLWKPTQKALVMGTGSDLWEAIQNSKVVLYYLMTSYLWHFPPSGCYEMRLKEPVEGQVE